MSKEKESCLNPFCEETIIRARGLCSKCYHSALYLVKNERVTWKELEKLGKCKSPDRGHHRRASHKWFTTTEDDPAGVMDDIPVR